MSFAVDTNVLLRSIDVGHPAQPIAQNAMIRLGKDGESLSIFSQNLVEFWAVATRPIANNGLGLSIAQTGEELTELKRLFTLLPDTADILPEWERLAHQNQVTGKQAHDARLVAAMLVHRVTHLLTFNIADFKRYSEITVISPSAVQ